MSKNRSGFTSVEALIILMIVVLVGLLGWSVWRTAHKSEARQSSNNVAVSKINAVTPVQSKTKRTADLYDEWQKYCDNPSKLCFRYPPDWHITSSELDNLAFAEARNAANTVAVSYNSGYNKDGSTRNFFPVSTDSITGLAGLKVVGGVRQWGDFVASYDVVNDASLSGILPGKATQFIDTPRFMHSGVDYKFSTSTPGQTFASQAGAAKWFNTDEAKTALLILKSLATQ